MKNSILSIAVAALFFVGCGNNNSHDHAHDGEGAHEHTEGTHMHEDGTIHEDHGDEAHHQEEFKVKSDSISKEKEKRDTSRESGNHQQ